MKIATFNLNGVHGRLPMLLRWLSEAQPDVVCLQELKTPTASFPQAAINDAGYHAVWLGQKSWNGVAILARGSPPIETRRGLPGDPADRESRYIEGCRQRCLVACLYAPNGNPAPGPKFDFKLRWFERLDEHLASLMASGVPVVMAGDFNVIPTDRMSTRPSVGGTMPCFGRKFGKPIKRSSSRDGSTRSAICIRTTASIRSGNIGGMRLRGMLVSGLTISCSVPVSPIGFSPCRSIDMSGVGSMRAIMRRSGSSCAMPCEAVFPERAGTLVPPDRWPQHPFPREEVSMTERPKMQDPRTQYPKPPFPTQPQRMPGLAGKMDPHPDHGEDSYVGSGKLEGRKALITGGDSGIGRAAAIAFAREGADVAIAYLPEEQSDADEVIALIRREGRKAIGLAGDVKEQSWCNENGEAHAGGAGRPRHSGDQRGAPAISGDAGRRVDL